MKIIQPADKRWSELTDTEVKHFWGVVSKRAERLGDFARASWLELSKFLFAANTGAAAGLFILIKEPAHSPWFVLAFGIFCAGTTCVGIAYLLLARSIHVIAEGWAADANAWGRDEITLREVDARHSARQTTLSARVARYMLVLAFGLLIAGGICAAKPFWREVTMLFQP